MFPRLDNLRDSQGPHNSVIIITSKLYLSQHKLLNILGNNPGENYKGYIAGNIKPVGVHVCLKFGKYHSTLLAGKQPILLGSYHLHTKTEMLLQLLCKEENVWQYYYGLLMLFL